MSLQDYLTKYYPYPVNENIDSFYNRMKDDFISKFGVIVKFDIDDGNPLFLFKYDLIEAVWSFELVAECRGCIWRLSPTGWIKISNPWNKFWNISEGNCCLFDQKVFKSEFNSLSIVEKIDGSAIQVFFDGKIWRATTLGMIKSGQVSDFGISFDELFWKTLNKSYEDFAKIADINFCYLFELACKENIVVSKYKTNQIVLLSIRHVERGFYKSTDEIEDICLDMLQNGFEVRLPWRRQLYELPNVNDLESLKIWVETKGIEAIETGDVELSEGFVIYSGSQPKAKIKNLRYLSLHSICSDLKHSKNVVIERWFTGTIDDIFNDLPDSLKIFVESLELKVKSLIQTIRNASPNIIGVTFSSQKEYALTVQKFIPSQFWSFFFTYKNKFSDPKCDLSELFKEWLKVNFGKFDDYWKG